MTKLITNIPDRIYGFIKNQTHMLNLVDTDVVCQGIREGLVIPKKATNGDVFIKMYQPMCVSDNEYHVEVRFPSGALVFQKDWWDAPYFDIREEPGE